MYKTVTVKVTVPESEVDRLCDDFLEFIAQHWNFYHGTWVEDATPDEVKAYEDDLKDM